MKLRWRFAFALLLLVTALAVPAGSLASSGGPIVTLTPIGHPTWKPVDMHMFTAPIGTASSGYAEFGATMQALLPTPNHVVNWELGGIGPGAPHLPPYTDEFAAGVLNNQYTQGTSFDMSQFSNGQGVWFVYMVIPSPGAIGSSPDFASGPIIANSVFPIKVKGTTWRNGVVWNKNLGGSLIRALDKLIHRSRLTAPVTSRCSGQTIPISGLRPTPATTSSGCA